MRTVPGSRHVAALVGALVGLVVGGGGSSLGAQGLAQYEPPSARGDAFPLTIQSIMRGPELVGQSPNGVRWSDDGEWLYFRWLPGGNAWHEPRTLYRVRATGGEPERVSDEEELDLGPIMAPGDVSPDETFRVTSYAGDLYLIDRETAAARRLTHTDAPEWDPSFSDTGERVFFVRGSDLFAFTLEDGEIAQLTNIEGPERPEPPEAEGHRAFLEAQQLELFKHVQVRKQREERREARQDLEEARQRAALHLPPDESVAALTPGPDGRLVAVTVGKQAAGEPRRTDIPLWITESGYTENTEMRPKVGDVQSTTRIAILDTETGEAEWLSLGGLEDVSGAAESAADDSAPVPTNPALAVASFVEWDETGRYGLVFAVDFDYKAWRLFAWDAEERVLTLLDSLEDGAWVGGPCFAGCGGWLPSSEGADGVPRAFYVSEATGHSHLYTVLANGSDRQALTNGAWEVLGVTISEGWDAFILQTSEASPFDQHPYRMAFGGGERVRLLEGEGSFAVTPSPAGDRFAVIHSVANRPPELYLADASPGANLEQVTSSPTEEWLGAPWIRPEIVHFEARDGIRVPARIYRPSDVGGEPNGAGVIFVHGAGYLHNVHNWWSNYYREYMFHHLLAAEGYTVLDIDYRGSAGYGRDWRTAIYRHMGGWDLSDHVDGARYLVSEEGVDAGRIGIYGGSYGGFITLMALFTEAETFAAGAALRSVTDWAHYNHWYTSRILNLPHEDEEAYRQSSPIYFAEGLEGHLLIAHGMYDTNVHFSDVVRLAQRLIELGKEKWEMAVYPVENHGFVEPSSWIDEYRRIFELFQRTISG